MFPYKTPTFKREKRKSTVCHSSAQLMQLLTEEEHLCMRQKKTRRSSPFLAAFAERRLDNTDRWKKLAALGRLNVCKRVDRHVLFC